MHALSFCRKALLFLFIMAIFSASGIASTQPSPALSAILCRYLVTDWASGLAYPEKELLKDLDPVLKTDSLSVSFPAHGNSSCAIRQKVPRMSAVWTASVNFWSVFPCPEKPVILCL